MNLSVSLHPRSLIMLFLLSNEIVWRTLDSINILDIYEFSLQLFMPVNFVKIYF